LFYPILVRCATTNRATGHRGISLSRHSKEKRRISDFYRNKIRKAKEEKKPEDETNKLVRALIQELDEINDLITELQSDVLISRAERLGVVVPPHRDGDERWQLSVHTERLMLSSAGMQELRSAIRTERKERSELFRSWLTSLTGLIGVLIGLLAVILRKQ
jgi:23S rRNA G2069 N7-methylase RlmK/C1962 C5-methylase RlmI